MSTHFRELRLRQAETRALLRAAKDTYELAKAEATQRAKEASPNGKLGSNDTDRECNLALALRDDPPYQQALVSFRRAEAECERVEALLESARDERRASEWQIRMRLADALFRAGVQSDDTDLAGDGAFDDTYDEQAARYASGFSQTLRRQQAPPNGTEEYEELPF